ncbi:MAG: hypothetical protein ACYC27_08415 [Armatimonadota bacterium]
MSLMDMLIEALQAESDAKDIKATNQSNSIDRTENSDTQACEQPPCCDLSGTTAN